MPFINLQQLVIRMLAAYFLILFSIAACTAPNYQERKIYYSEQDNCCIEKSDSVILAATFNDRPKVELTIDGGTFCREFPVLYMDKLIPNIVMSYTHCYHYPIDPDFYCDQIKFDQETSYQHIGRLISSITQKVTIRNPSKFDNKDYNCVIEGDGTVQHYGPIGSVPAPKLFITCTKIASNIRKEAS